MSDPGVVATAPSRRRGLSLRLLLALVLLMGGGVGWYASRVRVQRDAVALVLRHGEAVYYAWEESKVGSMAWSIGKIVPGATQPPPQWLLDRLGPDWLGNVTAVFLGPKEADATLAAVARLRHLRLVADIPMGPLTDAGLGHLRGLTTLEAFESHGKFAPEALGVLAGLTELRALVLTQTRPGDAGLAALRDLSRLRYLDINHGEGVTDAGFRHLAGLTALQRLGLPGTQVRSLEPLAGASELMTLTLNSAPLTDASLAPLARLTRLRGLAIADADLTDAGLVHLEPLTGLISLTLSGTRITDASLTQIGRRDSLQVLDLSRTAVTDAGLAELSGQIALRNLTLIDTAVGDAGLAHLAGLQALSVLNLQGTRVGDASVPTLASLPALTFLAISRTAITPEGRDSLRQLRPKLRIAGP